MLSIFIIAEKNEGLDELRSGLMQMGFACSVISDGHEVVEKVMEHAPHLILLESNSNFRIKESANYRFD